jgi:hypothetical protein
MECVSLVCDLVVTLLLAQTLQFSALWEFAEFARVIFRLTSLAFRTGIEEVIAKDTL